MENNEKRTFQRNVGPNRVHEKPKNNKKSMVKLLRTQQKVTTFLYYSNNVTIYLV